MTYKNKNKLSLLTTYKQELNESLTLREGASLGVSLEWAIVALAKDRNAPFELPPPPNTKDPKKLQAHLKKVEEYKTQLFNAMEQLSGKVDLQKAIHSDTMGIKASPEPKTDILFGDNVRVSVKMDGDVQLSSAQGKATADMLTLVMKEVISKNIPIVKQRVLSDVIKRIKAMPTKLISAENLNRALEANPNIVGSMITKKGNKYSIIKEYSWEKWEAENKEQIVNSLTQVLSSNPEFKIILVDEALTGRRLLVNDYLADANYILSPNNFSKIDRKYVEKVSNAVKVDLRAKSRSAISSATIRFDLKAKEMLALYKTKKKTLNEQELTLQGIERSPTRNLAQVYFGSDSPKADLSIFDKEADSYEVETYLQNFQQVVSEWYVENIEDIIFESIEDLEVSVNIPLASL